MGNKIFSFVILLIILGCDPQIVDSQIKIDKIKKKEDFKFFYTKFCSDSLFQISRINFPLKSETYDIDEESFGVSKLSIQEWKYMDFKHLGQEYQSSLNVLDEFATLIIQKKETGISVKYIFELSKNQWFLVKVIDEST